MTPSDIQQFFDRVSGLTLAELALIAYVLATSFNPETRRLEIEGAQSLLLGGGAAAALVGEKKRKPPDENEPTATDGMTGAAIAPLPPQASAPVPATPPDFAHIATLGAPESHERPEPPLGDEDADDSEEDDLGVLEYLKPEHIRYEAEALQLTHLKTSTADSSTLGPDEKVEIAPGHRVPIETWAPCDGGHWAITSQGQTYYIYSAHFKLFGPDGAELGTAKPHRPRRPVTLVTGERIDLDSPIIVGGNFTWGEFTRGGERMPQSAAIVGQVRKAAEAMQEIRGRLGDRPITVTSAYRPPAVNRRVGGASQSRHLFGDAVDFVVSGMPALEVERRLDSWWGSRGGLASSRRHGFTHIDLRGVRARWNY